jgi:predicted DNA-binding protein with PD1-like motif
LAKIYSLPAGAKIPEDIVSIARKGKIITARVEAIGGVDKLRLAYFNHKTKKYEDHDYDEFLEVTSLLGNITLKDSKQYLHAHGNFGRSDQSVVGGHIVNAVVYPLLEVVITPTKNRALRKFDESLGLNVIYRT